MQTQTQTQSIVFHWIDVVYHPTIQLMR
jgi:hypothetical protein